MATTSDNADTDESRRPPEVIDLEDGETMELAFRDERLIEEEVFEMPSLQD